MKCSHVWGQGGVCCEEDVRSCWRRNNHKGGALNNSSPSHQFVLLMESDPLLLKKRIVEAAIDLSINAPERFTVKYIVEAAEVDEATFYSVFNSKHQVLPAFYNLCVEQYEALVTQIEGYEAFTLEERLATFIYILFDALEEQKEFVDATFDAYIVREEQATRFQTRITRIFADLLESDDVPVTNRVFTDWAFLHEFLTARYIGLVEFWITDESPSREKTTAYVDKLVGFFAECVTFKGVERGVDLVRYMAGADIINVRWVPVLGKYLHQNEE